MLKMIFSGEYLDLIKGISFHTSSVGYYIHRGIGPSLHRYKHMNNVCACKHAHTMTMTRRVYTN